MGRRYVSFIKSGCAIHVLSLIMECFLEFFDNVWPVSAAKSEQHETVPGITCRG
jgi:hypothetical protein